MGTPTAVDELMASVERNMNVAVDDEEWNVMKSKLVRLWKDEQEKEKWKQQTRSIAAVLCQGWAENALRKELIVRTWVAVGWLRLYRRSLHWQAAYPRVLQHMDDLGEAYAAVWWTEELWWTVNMSDQYGYHWWLAWQSWNRIDHGCYC